MLFVGDCHAVELADKWIKEYGDKLKADYAQMGHHGNNSLPIWFYEHVDPVGVFFDAPGWLMEGDQYDSKENRDGIEEIAENIYDYSTSPNKVKLYDE